MHLYLKSESLINEIEEKRNELSSLLRSNNADKALIDMKVEELNNLERYLDERIQ
jgi:Spy/CpxP family protein refolding chaperone